MSPAAETPSLNAPGQPSDAAWLDISDFATRSPGVPFGDSAPGGPHRLRENGWRTKARSPRRAEPDEATSLSRLVTPNHLDGPIYRSYDQAYAAPILTQEVLFLQPPNPIFRTRCRGRLGVYPWGALRARGLWGVYVTYYTKTVSMGVGPAEGTRFGARWSRRAMESRG